MLGGTLCSCPENRIGDIHSILNYMQWKELQMTTNVVIYHSVSLSQSTQYKCLSCLLRCWVHGVVCLICLCYLSPNQPKQLRNAMLAVHVFGHGCQLERIVHPS